MNSIEMILKHDGDNWTAEGENLHFSAPTLQELDSEMRRYFKEQGLIETGKKKVEVFMAFDNSIIPQWMRQYGHHYFNRIVVIEG